MKYSKLTLETAIPVTDFAGERNRMLEKTAAQWVLFVDSDEEVPVELDKEILNLDGKHDGYFIRRNDYFLGRWLKFGETGNIKLLRLGKKGAGHWRRKVHEFWDIKNTGELKKPLLHYPALTIEKINRYSDIDAGEFGYFSLPEVFFKPAGKFLLNYFFRLGFLDGTPGFIHAFMMSFQSLVVRVKQYDLSLTNPGFTC